MNQVTTIAIEDAAIRAVYELQYNTNKAARYVVGEVPSTPYEDAVAIINRIVRPAQPTKAKTK